MITAETATSIEFTKSSTSSITAKFVHLFSVYVTTYVLFDRQCIEHYIATNLWRITALFVCFFVKMRKEGIHHWTIVIQISRLCKFMPSQINHHINQHITHQIYSNEKL